MFFFEIWKAWVTEGLRLFAHPQSVLNVSVEKALVGKVATPHGVRKTKPPPPKQTRKLVHMRAPRGQRALIVQASRESRPSTPSSGRRNGSR